MITGEQIGLGLWLVEEFISREEEQAILACLPPHSVDPKQKERNNIWRYGKQTAYQSNVVSKTIPTAIHEISERLAEKKLLDEVPMSITVNCYFKGQIIKPHIDAFNTGPVITVLSLANPATMTFSNKAKVFHVELPPRSIVQMRDEIRNKWQHSIERLDADVRYSVVFRR